MSTSSQRKAKEKSKCKRERSGRSEMEIELGMSVVVCDCTYVCLCVCVCGYVCVYVCLCLCLSVCPSVCLSVFVCAYVCVLWVGVFYVYMDVWVCVCMCLSVCLFVCVCLCWCGCECESGMCVCMCMDVWVCGMWPRTNMLYARKCGEEQCARGLCPCFSHAKAHKRPSWKLRIRARIGWCVSLYANMFQWQLLVCLCVCAMCDCPQMKARTWQRHDMRKATDNEFVTAKWSTRAKQLCEERKVSIPFSDKHSIPSQAWRCMDITNWFADMSVLLLSHTGHAAAHVYISLP